MAFRRTHVRSICSLMMFGWVWLPALAPARTWRVPAEAPTIQAAVDSAISGDDVLLASGTYTWSNQGAAFPAMVRLKPGIWLHGESGAATTILDGEGIGRPILCKNIGNSVVIQGLTIQNGIALPQIQPLDVSALDHENRYGGGLWASGNSDITVRECVFQRNQNLSGQSAIGGAIACGPATIQDCQFFDNSARGSGGGGGAILCGVATIERCTFVNNVAVGDGNAAGGAVESDGGWVRDCTFSSNRASAFRNARGGALATEATQVTSCIFRSNSVQTSDGVSWGGALGMVGGSASQCFFWRNVSRGNLAGVAFGGAIHGWSAPSISECVFIENTAKRGSPERSGIGGALVMPDGGAVENCTLIGNSGNAVDGVGGFSINGAATVRSVIVVGTVGVVCTGVPGPTWTCSDLYDNAAGNAICGTDGGGNFTLDPRFCAKDPAVSEDVTLQKNSPCAPGQSPGGSACGLIGAGAVTCAPLSIEKRSWSDVKKRYR